MIGVQSIQHRRGEGPIRPAAAVPMLCLSLCCACLALGQQGDSKKSGEPRQTISRRAPAAIVEQFRRLRLKMSRANLELNGKRIDLSVAALTTSDSDYAGIAALKNGSALKMTHGPAFKFKTAGPLRFGATVIPTGNVMKDFPGFYSLWIKKVEGGWRLVFNDEPDTWGTQHTPEADRAEIALNYERAPNEAEKLSVKLEAADAPGEGLLQIAWGPHRWSASFAASPSNE